MRHSLDLKKRACSTEFALEIIGGKWKLMILYNLFGHTMRFGELHRQLSDITPRMLTRQLRELEEDGIVHREVYAEVPPKVEYSLTDIGESLESIVKQIDEWGSWYRDEFGSEFVESATPEST